MVADFLLDPRRLSFVALIAFAQGGQGLFEGGDGGVHGLGS